jgi:hypothetical protein
VLICRVLLGFQDQLPMEETGVIPAKYKQMLDELEGRATPANKILTCQHSGWHREDVHAGGMGSQMSQEMGGSMGKCTIKGVVLLTRVASLGEAHTWLPRQLRVLVLYLRRAEPADAVAAVR